MRGSLLTPVINPTSTYIHQPQTIDGFRRREDVCVSARRQRRPRPVCLAMPLDCGLLCLFTDRRRYIEILWRHRLLVTADERKAKRRFMNLMRGFDTEDLDVLRKAVESRGLDIKQCAPGPPMDIVEDSESEDEALPLPPSVARRASVVSSRLRRYSTVRMDHLGGTTMVTTVVPVSNHISRIPTHRHHQANHVSPHHRQGSQRHSHRSPRSGRAREDLLQTAISPEPAPLQAPTSQRQTPAGPSMDINNMNLIGNTGEFQERGLIPQIDRPMSMPYLCCKMWRWKDLQVDAALHRLDPLPWCRFGRVTINNATVSCCNPYHYGLWIRPEFSSTASEDKSISGIVANGGGRLGERSETDTGFGDEMSAQAARSIGHVRADFQMKGQSDTPPLEPPPLPPSGSASPVNNNLSDNPILLNHLTSIHSQALAWGRMARWERKERIGDMIPLVGDFVAVGQLAGTVFDGQDVKCNWDVDNRASFALLKQSEVENFEDIWLYNSGERPIFMCVSQSIQSMKSAAETIRRLSPGYCIRVHRKNTETPEQEHALLSTESPPIGVSFLTISIGVGWGINYQRF
ncbi:unnamed protein product [Bursaphelenchus xylophilus]|uniref:(pine wood nematode) hypothetical protein n=1 Tax=Bursaphelenchus xylophilus TaxID=6326 RepID=A0A7I8XJG6_BURXY|nr:unnamed protein product [Bursaphelenchus xylophilus]CAG9085613.1 unnamed protein product [Bursaphelenchus xylophilus]